MAVADAVVVAAAEIDAADVAEDVAVGEWSAEQPKAAICAKE